MRVMLAGSSRCCLRSICLIVEGDLIAFRGANSATQLIPDCGVHGG